MTRAQRELKQFLGMLRDCAVRNATPPKRWKYKGPADLLLREGKFYKPSAEAVRWERSEPQACFRNAAMYAAMHPGARYVEGYALAIIPVHHGWCADADGNVIEVTWKDVGSLYFGVEFPFMAVTRGAVLFNERNRGVYSRQHKKPPVK